jgi:hypothetical protein
VVGNFVSAKENVDEDILQLGMLLPHSILIDLTVVKVTELRLWK